MFYFREMLMENHYIDFFKKLIVSFVFGLQQDEPEIKQIFLKSSLAKKRAKVPDFVYYDS